MSKVNSSENTCTLQQQNVSKFYLFIQIYLKRSIDREKEREREREVINIDVERERERERMNE